MAYDYGTGYYEPLDIASDGAHDFDVTLRVGESFSLCMLSGSEKITGDVQWSLVNESKDSDGNTIIAAEVSSEWTLTGRCRRPRHADRHGQRPDVHRHHPRQLTNLHNEHNPG